VHRSVQNVAMPALLRHGGLIVAAAVALLGLAVADEIDPELRDGLLTVDGKPFFLFGTWGRVKSAEFMREYDFNCMLSYFAHSLTQIDDDEAAGLWHIPYLMASQWDKRGCERIFKKLVARKGVLCWNLGDDMTPEHADDVRRAYEWIRANDPENRPLMIDVPGSGSANAYQWFDGMVADYLYPLLKQPLAEYQKTLRATRAAIGDDRYFWTWIQSHTQDWYNRMFLSDDIAGYGKVRPFIYPDPELVRLLCYHAIAAGAKGLLCFPARFFPPEIGGGARLAEFAILANELEVIGPWIVAGREKGKLRCTPEADATRFDFPGGTLVLVIRDGPNFEYHPDAAYTERTTVRLDRAPAKGARALRVDFPEVRELPLDRGDDGVDIEIGPWELTAAVLVTNDASLLEETRRRVAERLPEVARFAVEVARTKNEHVARTVEELRALEAAPARLPDAGELKRAGEEIDRAQSLREEEQHAQAYVAARRAQRRLRGEVYRSWNAMWDDPALAFAVHERTPTRPEVVYKLYGLQDFYLMPIFYRTVYTQRHGKRSDNLIGNSGFEEIKGGKFVGWDTSVLPAHAGEGKEVPSPAAHSGRASLAITSTRPARRSGTNEEVDWVTFSAVSAYAPARQGDVIDVSVWLRIDEDFKKTTRGAVVNLVGKDGEGKTVSEWGGGRIEVARFERTDGWIDLSIVRLVNLPSIRRVALRLGTCGVGTVLFDDVSLVVTRRAPEN